MSLTGDLEDLPLLDILQIVSFSKKTGYLSIGEDSSEGAIVFDGGFVVAAFNRQTPPLDPRARTLAPGKRDVLLRARIEMALEQLIRLRDGAFNFSLTEGAPVSVAGRDIADEMLSEGINGQELLLDLARGMDEDRRESTAALEVSFAEPDPEAARLAGAEAAASPAEDGDEGIDALLGAAPALRAGGDPTSTVPPPPAHAPPPMRAAPRAAAPAARAPRTILLVDDEDDVRRVLGEHFTRAGHPVVEAGDPDGAVKKAAALARAGEEYALVIDLGMPTTGGTSFQGGFEVVKRLLKQGVRPPILLMTDSLGGPTLTRAKQMGIGSFVFKPGLSKLDAEQFEADLRAFAAKILADVLPRLKAAAPGGPGAPPPSAPPAAKMAAKPAAAAPASRPGPAPPATADELSRELAMLQQRLDELRRPQDPTQIAALIMGVAREFFERAVLFLVKNDELRGVNGFGPAARGEQLGLLARELVIPLAEKSILGDVVAARRGFTGALPLSESVTDLMDRIGRLAAGDAALLPLVTHRETIAVLFGDNPESGRPPGHLDGLRVFINQAGIALENAFLHRKVHALTGEE